METDNLSGSDIELKNRIMSVAREQFYQYGFSKVTVDEIASKLGMSKKTLYRLFPSKDALVLEVVRKTIREMDAQCQGIVNQDNLSFVEKMKQMMTQIGLQYSKMSRHLIEDLEKTVPLVWKEISDYRTVKIQKDFGILLTEGIKQGFFRSDIDQNLILLIYSNVMRNVITPEILSQLPFSAQQVFETVITVMFEGILTDEAKKQYSINS